MKDQKNKEWEFRDFELKTEIQKVVLIVVAQMIVDHPDNNQCTALYDCLYDLQLNDPVFQWFLYIFDPPEGMSDHSAEAMEMFQSFPHVRDKSGTPPTPEEYLKKIISINFD